MARVFISHASVDTGWAEQVRDWLAEDGHETFLDQHQDDGILPGEDWEKRLYSELHAADAVVCVVTESYVQSVWCAAEIGAARALGAELLPVRFSAATSFIRCSRRCRVWTPQRIHMMPASACGTGWLSSTVAAGAGGPTTGRPIPVCARSTSASTGCSSAGHVR